MGIFILICWKQKIKCKLNYDLNPNSGLKIYVKGYQLSSTYGLVDRYPLEDNYILKIYTCILCDIVENLCTTINKW